uniref:Uncharacterized protein n=1 Tax=Romanomermis culicivorax TaxID=13658 RepID=A0A915K6J7_ROMCU
MPKSLKIRNQTRNLDTLQLDKSTAQMSYDLGNTHVLFTHKAEVISQNGAIMVAVQAHFFTG